jgi:hypothetical protein
MKKAYLLIWAAWLLHFAAWFLPVIKPGEFRPAIPGWQAFRYAACGVWACKGVQFDAWYYAVLSTISAITTLFFILASPWVVLRGSRSLRRGFAWAAATAFIFNAHWIVIFGSERSELTTGYFLWWCSFLLLAIGLFSLAGGNRTEAAQRQIAPHDF